LSTSSFPVASSQSPIMSVDRDNLLFICRVKGGIYPRGIRNVDRLNRSKNTLYRSLEQKYHSITTTEVSLQQKYHYNRSITVSLQ
jgi:hypothetical protein